MHIHARASNSPIGVWRIKVLNVLICKVVRMWNDLPYTEFQTGTLDGFKGAVNCWLHPWVVFSSVFRGEGTGAVAKAIYTSLFPPGRVLLVFNNNNNNNSGIFMNKLGDVVSHGVVPTICRSLHVEKGLSQQQIVGCFSCLFLQSAQTLLYGPKCYICGSCNYIALLRESSSNYKTKQKFIQYATKLFIRLPCIL